MKKAEIPLNVYADWQAFKVYLLDVGLLNCMARIAPKTIIAGNRIFEEFKGTLTEQYVLQELKQFEDIDVYYWTSAGKAEVDYVVIDGYGVYPMEVKAGTSTQAQSLQVYRKKYNPSLAIKATLKNYGENDGVVSLPLFMLFALHDVIGE